MTTRNLTLMWSATFGAHIWRGEKAIYHYHIWKVTCDEVNITKLYLFQLLEQKTQEWLNKSNGMGILHVTKGNMENMLLTLPPLVEQQKIAAILTSVDEVIESTQAQINKLKDLKTGMMQELLTKGIGHTEFKDSPVGRIPETWSVAKFNKILEKVGSGITPTGGNAVYTSSGIPFIRSQNVYSDGLRWDDICFISEEQHKRMSNSQLKEKDVLLNITGASIGRCYYLPDNFREGNVNQHVCILRCNPNYVNHIYLSQFISSPIGQKQIMSLQAGGNREGLNFQQIRAMDIALPPLPEQALISEIITSISDNIKQKTIKLNALQNTKKALMQDLLTGKVRVKVS